MNKLKNCPECGKLYLEVGQGMCPACYDIELEQEQVVHTYIRDHDKCSIKQIVEDTGVKDWPITTTSSPMSTTMGMAATSGCGSCRGLSPMVTIIYHELSNFCHIRAIRGFKKDIRT